MLFYCMLHKCLFKLMASGTVVWITSIFWITFVNSVCAHYPWTSVADFPFGFTLASSFQPSGSYPPISGSSSSSSSSSSTSSSCGGSMSLTHGSIKYIMSPRYPEAYPPNTQCRWEVTAPFGSRIALSFENLVMPTNEIVGCTGDRIEVLDIQYTYRVCFSQYGAFYLTLAPSVTVLFTSDRIREDFPARFRIRLELNRSWCGGDLTEPSGDIISPNYPRSYPSNTVCGWKIKVPVGSRISLNCDTSFWLEPSVDCTNDFLAVSTSGDETMKTSSRFCGSSGPEMVTSVSNVMTVFFNSNIQFEFGGFRCRYEMFGSSYRYPSLLGSAVSQNTISMTTSPLPPPPPQPPYFSAYPLIATAASSPTVVQCDCGLSNKKSTREARIVGGTQTQVNEYPWVVAIFKRDGRQYCAGSLINDLYVLTASHCVARLRPSDIYVSLGDHDLDITEETRHVIVKVRRIVVHPGYRSTPVETDDIALLELSHPTSKTTGVRPICLPTMDVDIRGQTPTVVGWGKLSEAGLSTSVLRETSLPIQPNGECQRAYGYSVVTDNMICAGQPDGTTDACQGDSGGPMMVTQQSRWHIIGLVSYGFGCARPEFPGVYTRIDRYLDWIRENTVGSSLCSTPPPPPPPPPPPQLPQPASLFASRPQSQDLYNRIFNRFGWGWNFDRQQKK